MYQAGIKNISLYENKGIDFYYYDPLDDRAITDLTGTGSIILVENYQQPTFNINSSFSSGGNVVNEYELKFFILGLLSANNTLISQIKKSVYGWCILIEFYDGTFKFYNTPMFCRESSIDPNAEMSFTLTLKTATPTVEMHLDYTPNVSTVPIYRADTTLVTADSTIYTADYAL